MKTLQELGTLSNVTINCQWLFKQLFKRTALLPKVLVQVIIGEQVILKNGGFWQDVQPTSLWQDLG